MKFDNSNKEIGEKWTETERLHEVFLVAEEMQMVATSRVMMYPEIRERIFRWYERLRFLSTASSEFLEDNRDQVLGSRR